MDKFDRIYALHKLLSAHRYPVPRRQIEEKLECGRATVGRIINYMRDSLGAPLEYDRVHNGWYYDRREGEHPYELPGLWFNAQELQALAIISELIHELQPGLLDEELRPFTKRINALLASRHFGNDQLTRRLRILGMGARHGGEAFEKVAEAVLQRKRLAVEYHARSNDQTTRRTISPQRLVRYRDNWYLDAWCHKREDLRSFALERIGQLTLLKTPAREFDEHYLDQYYASAYGIFAGQGDNLAVLRFTPFRARWVAEERWHPRQEGRYLDDGHYELRIPYGHPHELIMDILKYGADVEVVGPPDLRRAVMERLRKALAGYEAK